MWTSGDALVGAAHRLVGTPTGDGALAVGYALIAIEIAVVALYGHGTVVALQRIVVPVVGVLLLLGIPAFAGGFDAGHAGGDYVLGGFWSTWMLAVTVAAAGPLSYAPSLGDYTRRISRHATATAACCWPRAAGSTSACSSPRCSARSPRSRSSTPATPTSPTSSPARPAGTCCRSS